MAALVPRRSDPTYSTARWECSDSSTATRILITCSFPGLPTLSPGVGDCMLTSASAVLGNSLADHLPSLNCAFKNRIPSRAANGTPCESIPSPFPFLERPPLIFLLLFPHAFPCTSSFASSSRTAAPSAGIGLALPALEVAGGTCVSSRPLGFPSCDQPPGRGRLDLRVLAGRQLAVPHPP